MTEYNRIKKSMVDFKKMLESRVTYAFDQRDEHDNETPFDELYREKFQLSFMSKTCNFYFGATEFQAVIDMLQMIIEEM